GKLIQINSSDQFTHSLGTHASTEHPREIVTQFTTTILLKQVHFLQTLQISTHLLQTLARLIALLLNLRLSSIYLTLILNPQTITFSFPLRLRCLNFTTSRLGNSIASRLSHTL